MNLQKDILTMLKQQPMGREDIINAFPDQKPTLVNRSLTMLIISGKVDMKQQNFYVAKKKNKYNAIKTEVDGIIFDSKMEANRYTELKVLLRAGLIRDLERQVSFIVSDAVEWGEITLSAIKYKCDFRYYDCSIEKEVVEDVKGKALPLYILKRSLFIQRYPEYRFREIKK